MTSSKSWFLGSWSNPIFSIKVIKFINQSSFKLYYFQSFQRDCGVAIKGNANLTNMTCKWFFFTINLQISDAPFGKMTQSYCCWTPHSHFLYHDVQLGVYLWLPTLLQRPDLRSVSSLSSVCSDSTIRLPLKPQLWDERKAPAPLALWNSVPSPAFCCATTCFFTKNNSRFPKFHKCGCVVHRSHKNAELRRPGTCCQTSQQQYHLSPNYTIASK